MKAKKIIKWFLISILVIITLVETSIFFYPNVYINHPNFIQINDVNKEKQFTFIHDQIGDYVYLDQVSPAFISTLIQIEDKRFYSHHGFDYLRIGKSLFEDLKSQDLSQGGSTITQQLARTIYLNNSKSFFRKINEAYIAKKIENKYSKKTILELYINSVYFAHNLYGINQASHYYFNKSPDQLTYQDACILVGIINAPNIYSPFINYELCIEKMNDIAYNLYTNNIINVEEYYKIISTNPNLYGQKEQTPSSLNYYYQGIKRELISNGIDIDNNFSEGLIIDSYLDINIQERLTKIISSYKTKDEIAAVVLKPNSNKILALVGGKDYQSSQFNRALDAKRPIGSTIKPFIYYLGLTNGLTPLSEFTSRPTKFVLEDGTTYSPKNATDTYAYRKINMVEALSLSDNIYAVKATLFVGSENVAKLLERFNVDISDTNLTISLGNVDMSPLKLASLYNCLASEGTYYQPHFISSIKKHSGEVVYQNTNNGKKMLKSKETIMLNYMLQSPFDNAFSTYATPTMKNYQVNIPFCVKTGTTYSSSYTVGFNKDYTILIYVGSDENDALSDGTISKKIFRDLVNSLPENGSFYGIPHDTKTIKFHNSLYNTYSKTYLTYKK